jgi:hypothetical protein
VFGNEVDLRAAGKSEAVNEEEAKYDHDGAEQAPPEPLVHHGLGLLLAIDEVFHSSVET